MPHDIISELGSARRRDVITITATLSPQFEAIFAEPGLASAFVKRIVLNRLSEGRVREALSFLAHALDAPLALETSRVPTRPE